MSTDHVADKVIIVTGASSGFGRLVAQKAAERRAWVVAADINEPELAATVDSIRDRGGTAQAVFADVTDLGQMEALAAAAIEKYGRIDVMVNNAGTMPLAFHADHARAAEAWDRCIDVNIKGVLHGIMAVHDQMISQGRGHVINLSSIYGNFPVAGAGVYGATKAAVNFLSESLRVESQGQIKVTTVKPTGVPATGLGAGVVNPEAIVGILGTRAPEYLGTVRARGGGADDELFDPENMGYLALDPELLADQIMYAIDQPWGVSIGDITVRASGDRFLL
ncbi:MAG: SDR family oxidoreductase [Actinomycetia bacterium]|nr:SDR family oxidoreductase [Actinomycetes bacterium]